MEFFKKLFSQSPRETRPDPETKKLYLRGAISEEEPGSEGYREMTKDGIISDFQGKKGPNPLAFYKYGEALLKIGYMSAHGKYVYEIKIGEVTESEEAWSIDEILDKADELVQQTEGRG